MAATSSYTPVASSYKDDEDEVESFEIDNGYHDDEDEEQQEEKVGKGRLGGKMNQVDISCRILFVTVIVILLLTVASSNTSNNDNKNKNENTSSNNDIIPPTSSSSSSTTTTATTNDDDDEWWKMTTQTADTLIQDIYDMDIIKETTGCGAHKCFFASLSHPNEYGYLIGQDRAGKSVEIFEISGEQKSYDFALMLQQDFGLRSFEVAPPIIMDCTTELANVLNLGLHSHFDRLFDDRYSDYDVHPFEGGLYADYKVTTEHTDSDSLVVQIVKQAPKPNIEVHFLIQLFMGNIVHGSENENDLITQITPYNTKSDVRNFFENISNNDIHTNHLTSNTTFTQNLWDDWNLMREAIYAHPELILDFQFLLDTQGHIWQIDLDRVYSYDEDSNWLKNWQKIVKNNMVNSTLDLYETMMIEKIDNCAFTPGFCLE